MSMYAQKPIDARNSLLAHVANIFSWQGNTRNPTDCNGIMVVYHLAYTTSHSHPKHYPRCIRGFFIKSQVPIHAGRIWDILFSAMREWEPVTLSLLPEVVKSWHWRNGRKEVRSHHFSQHCLYVLKGRLLTYIPLVKRPLNSLVCIPVFCSASYLRTHRDFTF